VDDSSSPRVHDRGGRDMCSCGFEVLWSMAHRMKYSVCPAGCDTSHLRTGRSIAKYGEETGDPTSSPNKGTVSAALDCRFDSRHGYVVFSFVLLRLNVVPSRESRLATVSRPRIDKRRVVPVVIVGLSRA